MKSEKLATVALVTKGVIRVKVLDARVKIGDSYFNIKSGEEHTDVLKAYENVEVLVRNNECFEPENIGGHKIGNLVEVPRVNYMRYYM